MEKKHRNPPENFCSGVPIMHPIGSCSARSKYNLTIKNLVCTHFYNNPDFRGLAIIVIIIIILNKGIGRGGIEEKLMECNSFMNRQNWKSIPGRVSHLFCLFHLKEWRSWNSGDRFARLWTFIPE